MRWHPLAEFNVRMASLAVLVSATITVASAWQFARVPPVPATAETPATTPAVEEANGSSAPPEQLVALAPFSPDRKDAPAEVTGPPTPATAGIVPGGIRLLGTVVGDGAPFAVCRLGSAPARLLHPGDTLGGWRLQAIAPGRVTFIDDDDALHEVRLSSAGN